MQNNNTIEEKRRKNLIDNQKFLENLKLINVRDEFKSAVTQKKLNRKKKIDQSEVRRSSRIQSMCRTNYYNESIIDHEDFVLSSDETSNDEEDDLSSAFTTKIDEDWEPLHAEKLSITKNTRPVRKTGSNGVKIFMPNTGLQASKVISKDTSHKIYVTRRINVAISSSSEED